MTHGKMVVSARQVPRDNEKFLKENATMDELRLESALGHKQELTRNFSLWSLTSLGIIIAKYECCSGCRYPLD
jgi:choline transport protein